VKSIDEYVDLMSNLNLPNPKMMDVAVPANMRIGMARDIAIKRGWTLTPEEAKAVLGKPEIALIDLREDQERRKDGIIPGSLHVAYPDVEQSLKADGLLHTLATSAGKQLVFYCTFGQRSAMAVQAAQADGLETARHIQGGIRAWQHADGPLVR
jgi:rhodanese-related sulfurtransferase